MSTSSDGFDADAVSVECGYESRIVTVGVVSSFTATVTNDNDSPAVVDVTWSVGPETFRAGGQTVPADGSVTITKLHEINLSPGDYDASVSVGAAEK